MDDSQVLGLGKWSELVVFFCFFTLADVPGRPKKQIFTTRPRGVIVFFCFSHLSEAWRARKNKFLRRAPRGLSCFSAFLVSSPYPPTSEKQVFTMSPEGVVVFFCFSSPPVVPECSIFVKDLATYYPFGPNCTRLLKIH